MGAWADRLIQRLDLQAVWPSPDDQRVWNQVRTWIAFRESDRDTLRANARWRNQIREYRIDPLAPKISEAFASAMFGRSPTVTPADQNDLELAKNLVLENNLGRRLQREEKRTSSEAETWWRITSNPRDDEAPMFVFHSRLDVIPYFKRDLLRAAAFIDELASPAGAGESDVWRHFEIVDGEHITNVLYVGTHDTLGERLPLNEHPETEELFDAVEHQLPWMPAGRVVNREGVDPFYGLSDYSGIEDHLYGLNELLTIFHENVRLTLKKRVVVPASSVDEAGTIDASQEVLVSEALDHRLDKGAQDAAASQFTVLEYKSDIEEVITAQNAEAEAALTRIGITPAYVGMSVDKSEGRANSGTALRLRLIPTVQASEDRASYWDDFLPRGLCMLQLLDARSRDPGDGILPGFGRPWRNPGATPSVERGSSLPQDPIEETEVHASRVSASIESRYTAIKSLHPDWSDKQIQDEIARISEDLASTPSAQALGGLLGTGKAPPKFRGVE